MRPRFLSIVSATLLLLGAGCVLDTKIGLPAWFLRTGAPSENAAVAAWDLKLQNGTSLTIRPSVLGFTGALDEVLGDESRALHVTVREADPERFMRLVWKSASASGTLALRTYEGAHAMLLPVFWPLGEAEAKLNGGLWLSREAYDALKNDGTIEWRLGLAEQALASVSSAFKTFNDLSVKLSGSATSTQLSSPFRLQKTGTSDSFPLMVDGRLTFVRVVRATSWFADLFILDNPANPLILKVVVHPAAQPALKALASTSVRWNELGYEITSIFRP